jgi:hypothetical protein
MDFDFIVSILQLDLKKYCIIFHFRLNTLFFFFFFYISIRDFFFFFFGN